MDSSKAAPDDVHWMAEALRLARMAAAVDEVPVGAVVVSGGEIVGAAANATEAQKDSTSHAEMIAIRQAIVKLGSRRLEGSSLFVTLEPCAMCAGAVVLARIARLVFGAFDPKTGACGSLRNVVADERLNHRCEVVSGVFGNECAEMLRCFFGRLRAKR